MQWIWDNAVWVAAAIAVVAVLGAIAFAALRGWKLYRAVRAETRRVNTQVGVLTAGADRLQQRVADIQSRPVEMQQSIDQIRRHVAVLSLLGRHAAAAQQVLRGPLRYLGR